MPKTLALDTSLLVLLVVGLAKLDYIRAHKNLTEFTTEDFGLLKSLIENSAGIVVTPNVLSEASNLLRQIKEPAKSHIGHSFRNLIQNTHEIYVNSVRASGRNEFIRLGLADSTLLEISNDDIVVLSTDLDLCIAAQKAGYDAMNFNHLRFQQ